MSDYDWLGSLGGSVVSGLFNSYSARSAQQRSIAWERERATHAHQWEMEDLRNAGLNPILSAGGSGAQTSGVSSPYGEMPDFGSSISAGMNASTAKAQEKLNEKLGEVNYEATVAGIGKTQQEINTSKALQAVYKEQARQIRQSININSPNEGKSQTFWGQIEPYIADLIRYVVGPSATAVSVAKGISYIKKLSEGGKIVAPLVRGSKGQIILPNSAKFLENAPSMFERY